MLAALMLFSSCDFLPFGKTLDMNAVVDVEKYVDDNVVLINSEKIDALEDADCTSTSGDLALFTVEVDGKNSNKNTKYVVYNLETGAIVFDQTDSEKTEISVSLYDMNDVSFFKVTTVTQPKKNLDADPEVYTTLYTASGTEITYTDETAGVEKVAYDLFLFDDAYYSVANGQITFKANKNYFAKAISGSIFAYSDEYYYAKAQKIQNDYTEDGESVITTVNTYTVNVYDKNLKYVSTYTAPSYANVTAMLVLDNGKIFVQYAVEQDPYAFFYDVFENGEKYNLVTVLVDPATGEAKEISFNYLVKYAYKLDDETKEELCLKEDINNYVTVYAIEDKRIDESDACALNGVINDKGAFKSFECIEGKATSYVPYAINANLWAVSTVDGQTFFVDAEGNVKADVTNLQRYNDKYIVANGKVYSFDLAELYDYEAEELTLEYVLDTSIIFTGEEGETVIYANNTATTIVSEDSENLEFGGALGGECYYVIDSSKKTEKKYIVYNESGTEITTFRDCTSIRTVVSDEDYVIVRVGTKVDGEIIPVYEYYKLY